MPIALFLFGVLFLVAAVRGQHKELFGLLKDDFSGPGNFIYWGLSLWVIGAVGYYRPLRPVSHAFMFLVILVLFLSNRGFFNRFMEQIGASEKRVSTDFGDASIASIKKLAGKFGI